MSGKEDKRANETLQGRSLPVTEYLMAKNLIK